MTENDTLISAEDLQREISLSRYKLRANYDKDVQEGGGDLTEDLKMYYGTNFTFLDWIDAVINRQKNSEGISLEESAVDEDVTRVNEEMEHWYYEYSARTDDLQALLVEVNKIVLNKDTITKEEIIEKLTKIVEPYYSQN